jgi:ligand-binding sensor domain-containing protein
MLCVLVFAILPPAIASSSQLPIKTYTTADGLAQNAVNRIVRDSRGFLWFCAEEGLSRFDGYTFTTYGVEQDGNGLQSMRKRAKDSGGEVIISTNPPRGTTVTLRLPRIGDANLSE